MTEALERPRVLEGAWEDVVKEVGDLTGRRVMLTVYPETEAAEPETLADLLVGRTGRLAFEPSDLARNHRQHMARIMESKRKDGRT